MRDSSATLNLAGVFTNDGTLMVGQGVAFSGSYSMRDEELKGELRFGFILFTSYSSSGLEPSLTSRVVAV